jgi:flagellin
MSIAFNSAVAANLDVLRKSNEMFQVSQKRVSTGKMIFSAADDATRYTMSETMLGRSRQLDSVNNNISIGLKSLEATDKTLNNMIKQLEAAQELVRSAQSAGAENLRSATPTANISAATTVGGSAANDVFSITSDGGQTFTYTFQNATTTWGTVVDALNSANIGVRAEFVANGANSNIRFFATNGRDFTFNNISDEGVMATLTALTSPTGQTFNANNLFTAGTTVPAGTETGFTIAYGGTRLATKTGITTASAIAANSSLVVMDGNGQVRTFNYTGASTVNQFIADVNGSNSGLRAEIINQGGLTQLRIRNTNGGNMQILAGSGDFTGANIGFTVSTGYAAPLSTDNSSRLTLGVQYDNLLTQIGLQVANNPVPAGRNLLNGQNIGVVMDEFGGNQLTIAGVTITNAGLGLTGTGATWTTDANIQTSATQLNGALTQLRSQMARFATFTSYMKDRYDINETFSKELTSTGNELVAADVAEESANLTALQTQQQFAVQAFSMGSSTQQALLRLLG